ncbi:MAG: hypothetical protein F6K19_48050 [Cyanothece sp. SIO1E1]|nr:hypothetical protein [Cyanothece sp. SIO1E1]
MGWSIRRSHSETDDLLIPVALLVLFSTKEKEELRTLLCGLGNAVHTHVEEQRTRIESEELSAVSAKSESDTIYRIDRVSELALQMWFESHWPAKYPVEVIAEGLEEHAPVTYPLNTPVADRQIIDQAAM